MMRLTIIGFGNQAKSWAMNLKDSAFPVQVALRPGSSAASEASSAGIPVIELGSSEFQNAEVIALLTPDETHLEILKSYGSKLQEGSVILYAHGFSLLKHNLQETFPKLQHVLFAPKSIGSELRKEFLNKGKLGAVYSLEFYKGNPESFEKWLFSLASSMGINMGPYQTTFRHETEADLYSEQGLLCGLIPYAAGEMFNDLIEKGIEPELAYFECWHELKLIINAMVDKGPQGFFDLISPNALIGSEKGYQRLFSENFKASMKSLLSEIQDGSFNREISNTDVNETRNLIRERWEKSPLQKTFLAINQDKT